MATFHRFPGPADETDIRISQLRPFSEYFHPLVPPHRHVYAMTLTGVIFNRGVIPASHFPAPHVGQRTATSPIIFELMGPPKSFSY